MEKKDKESAVAERYETIEHWHNVHATSPAVYAGTMCYRGWKPGKQVTENEYLSAVAEFCQATMAGTGGKK